MPYYTGTANSASDLRQAIVNAGTANGWAWDATNSMLYKGDIYAKLTTSGLRAYVQTALGYSGGTLTNPAPKIVGITDQFAAQQNTPLSYPVTYHIFIHTGPDDIVCAVNYGATWWQWLAFGQGVNLGVAGKCVWEWGSCASDASGNTYGVGAHVDGLGTTGGISYSSGVPFWRSRCAATTWVKESSCIHIDTDGVDWASSPIDTTITSPRHAVAHPQVSEVINKTPITWAGHTVLAPLIVSVLRASSLWSYVSDLRHLRMTRNDYLTDGQIIEIGSEKWFCAPAYRKNASSRDGPDFQTQNQNHTGTIGIAVRYDGP